MAIEVSQQELEAKQDVELRVMAFARGIIASPEYQPFMQTNGDLAKNQETGDLLRKYQLKTAEVQRKGFDAASLDELKALRVRVKSNETLTAFYNTQAALVALLKQTNDRISEKIGQQFAQARQGGCC
ncbi:MAG TPA: YlbF family regulator [Methanoregulaceae archaeon]|nr:YlbF family regulator [Methanoregulaceae archaeon]